MAFDYPVPWDEYDELEAAEGGFWSSLANVATSFIPGPIDDIIVGAATRFFDNDADEEEQMSSSAPFSFAQSSPCQPPLVWDPAAGFCVFPTSPADISTAGPVQVGGGGISGRFGPALVPDVASSTVRRCPPPFVLGKDNLCYRKGDLRKDERKWSPGRKPLFTGGDLNAISRAHSLEKKAADIARKLGFNVRTKAAAASERARRGGRSSRGKSSGGITVIDTD